MNFQGPNLKLLLLFVAWCVSECLSVSLLNELFSDLNSLEFIDWLLSLGAVPEELLKKKMQDCRG